jgi:hypothetical protein
MKKILNEYQLLIGAIFLGLIISLTLYFIHYQKQKDLMIHNNNAYKVCTEYIKGKSWKDDKFSDCMSTYAIKPYLLKELTD